MYRILKGGTYWLLLDTDREGRRALVRPAYHPEMMAALIGRDKRTGRPFFIPVPPDIETVNEALDWIYRLEPGTWARAEKQEMKLIRHGDVVLIRLEGLPKGAKLLPHRWWFIPGEEGHNHRFENVRVFELDGEPLIGVLDGDARVWHEEHGPEKIPEGIWRIRTTRRFDPETPRGWSPHLD